MRAFTFIVAQGDVHDLLGKVKKIRGVKEASICTGGFDIIADIKAESEIQLQNIILEEIRSMRGVRDSVTFVAFENWPAAPIDPSQVCRAYILIKCMAPAGAVSTSADPLMVGKQTVSIPGVIEALPILGEYDVLAIAAVKEFNDLETLVTQHIHKIPGVERTETFPVFVSD